MFKGHIHNVFRALFSFEKRDHRFCLVDEVSVITVDSSQSKKLEEGEATQQNQEDTPTMTVQSVSREAGSGNDDVEIDVENLHDMQHDPVRPSSAQQHVSKPRPGSPPTQEPSTEAASAAEEEIRDAQAALLETGDGSEELPPLEVTEIEAEGEEEEEDGVPYDRGWAWMVVFGLFVNYALLAGFFKSSGLIFVELLRKFQAPVTQTALLFAVRAGVYSFSGFYVMNVLLGKFGSRKLVLTGAVLMSLSAILSSLANSLALLIGLHSVLLGVASTMLSSPGEVLVGNYFRKRRSLALSMAKCGASIGNVAVPPLLTFMLAEYGLTGTLLLYGGVCLHSLPAALLFRPTSYFSKQRHRPSRCEPGQPDTDWGTQRALRNGEKDLKSTCTHSNSSGTVSMHEVESDYNGKTLTIVEIVAPDKFTNRRHGNKDGSCYPDYLRSRSQEIPTEIVSVEECDVATLAKSHPELGMLSISTPPPLRKRTLSEITDGRSRPQTSAPEIMSGLLQAISQSSVVRYMSMSSLEGISSTFIPHMSDKDTKRTAHQVRDDGNQDTSRACSRALKSLLQCPKNFIFVFDFSLFRKPLFLLLMVYIMFHPFVNMPLDYLPAMASENGVPETQSALLLSVIGGLDFLSRLASGFIADLKVVRVSTMIAISFVILGVAMQFVRFMSTFEHFVALAVLQGMFGGVANCMFVVLIIEFVGLDNMGKGIGFCLLACGVSMAAAYPFLGYIRDVTGSYVMSYHVIGICIVVAAGLVSAEGPVRRFQERTQRRKQPENDVPQL